MSETVSEAVTPSGTAPGFSHPLLNLLVTDFKVSESALKEVNAQLPPLGIDLATLRTVLLQEKIVAPESFQQAIAQFFEMEYVPVLDDVEMNPEFTKLIPIRYAKKFMFFPIRLTERELWVVIENPDVLAPITDVGRKLGRSIRLVVSNHQAILSLINRAYDRTDVTADAIEVIDAANGASSDGGWGIEEPEDLIDTQDEEPIKRLLNNILYQAAKSNTSDVHIDSSPSEVVVRFRVDGVLHTTLNLPISIQRTLINRIKIMSRLDIAQRGLPQDGRTPILIAGRKIDIRVSTMPTVHGEKAVLRLLYQDQDKFDLDQLGMPPAIHKELDRLIHQTGGIILVSGPTGSGKTTTLYGALSRLDKHSNNIMTIEDPVEYKIPGYVQIEVNPKLGLTFANALRSVLRQDPDVIMVGEMRDRETALIAIQAALTGHLVFSTVHTNNAPATVTRLVDMGIEPYMISSTVMAVLAQRLVRRICKHCRTEIPVEKALVSELGLKATEVSKWKTLYKGNGCAECNHTGFKGRVGIYEMLMMTDDVKDTLLQNKEADIIRDAAIASGMHSMRAHGIDLIRAGVTTVSEVLHATQED